MVQFECPKVIHPFVSFTFGVCSCGHGLKMVQFGCPNLLVVLSRPFSLEFFEALFTLVIRRTFPSTYVVFNLTIKKSFI